MDWASYLEEFHGERPGITEALLERCANEAGERPYRWLTAAVSADGGGPDGPVIDVGCGNAPVAGHFERWVGADVSPAELADARSRGRGPLVVGSAEAMPVGSATAAVVLSVMALMVVDDPPAAVAEAARMLRPGGRLAILLPAQRPLKIRDMARYGLLLVAVGRLATPFPHRDVSAQLGDLLAEAGLEVTSDDRARFALAMDAPDAAELFVDALYLPGVSPRRIKAAKALARRWGTSDMGLALRRVVAMGSER